MDIVARHSSVVHLRKRSYDGDTCRGKLDRFLQSDTILFMLLGGIAATMFLLVQETNSLADGRRLSTFLSTCKIFLLIFYSTEVCIRVYVERLRYFKSFLNIVDMAVVGLDIVRVIVDSNAGSFILVLKALRLVRAAQSLRVMSWLPELATMVRGLVGAFAALLWGGVLMLFMLAVWGILATQLIHPLNEELTRQGVWTELGCARCPRAFSTVGNSMLTFTQQIVAGDSWGLLSVPIIESYPPTALFFTMVLMSVQLAVVNLILAIVLDKANESRLESEKELLAFREKEQKQHQLEMLEICRQMDADNSGQLAEDEIIQGFEENEDFRDIMRAMDIEKQDLEMVFRLMDLDGSGAVAYAEFTEQLFKMKTYDMHTMMVFIRYYVQDLWRNMKDMAAMASPCCSPRASPAKPRSPATPVDSGKPAASPPEAVSPPAEGRVMGAAGGEEAGDGGQESSSLWSQELEQQAQVLQKKLGAKAAAALAGPTGADFASAGPQPGAAVAAVQPSVEEPKAWPAGAAAAAVSSLLQRPCLGPLEGELERLREEIQISLEAIGEKLEGQAEILRAMPLLLERAQDLKTAALGAGPARRSLASTMGGSLAEGPLATGDFGERRGAAGRLGCCRPQRELVLSVR